MEANCSKKIKVAGLQTVVTADKDVNLENLRELLNDPILEGIDIVCLPEMWNCPYDIKNFATYAEADGGELCQELSKLAKEHNIYLQAGTVPEVDEKGKIYNTAYMFDRAGQKIGKYRKMHLFDIFASGEIVFKESDVLTGGDHFELADTEWGPIAINICFDIRFPESSRIPALAGAKVIINPGAFNMTTGPVHWQLGFRQRAIENQVFMIGTAPASDSGAGYKSWGHSIVTDPWGDILYELDEKPGIGIAELDLDYLDRVRQRMPLMSARRTDVYEVKEK